MREYEHVTRVMVTVVAQKLQPLTRISAVMMQNITFNMRYDDIYHQCW